MRIKNFLMAALLIPAMAAGLSAQSKKPLTPDVFDSWQSITGQAISPDGKVIAYQEQVQEGDGKLIVRTLGKGARTTEVMRGQKARITPDGRFAVCKVIPTHSESRRARIRKLTGDKAPKDSLAIIETGTGKVTMIAGIDEFSMPEDGSRTLAYTISRTVPAKKEGKKDLKKKEIHIRNLATGTDRILEKGRSYSISRDGKTVAYVYRKAGFRYQIALYDVEKDEIKILDKTASYCGKPVFNHDGTEIVFLTSSEKVNNSARHCAICRHTLGEDGYSVIYPQRNEDWAVTSNITPSFSRDGKRIFAGIQEFIPPKDTSIHPTEVADLDIWVWNASMTPPQQNVNIKKIRKAHVRTVVEDGRMKDLAPNRKMLGRFTAPEGWNGPKAMYSDRSETDLEYYNSDKEYTYYLVDTQSGQSEVIARGSYSDASMSPLGGYIAWFDKAGGNWILYDVAAKTTRNVTSSLGCDFTDPLGQHPHYPKAYGDALWLEDDKGLLLADTHDVWLVSTSDGSARRLTDGAASNRSYKVIDTSRRGEKGLRPADPLYFSIFDYTTKDGGIAVARAGINSKVETAISGPFQAKDFLKAEDKPVLTYLRGSCTEPYDLYTLTFTKKKFKEEKLTATNPMQKDYNWMTSRLFKWTAYDDTPLEGLVYLPEDFDPAKKYPVIVYMYEKQSHNLNKYFAPAPSANVPNMAYSVSNGYIYFRPDIHYKKDGKPGQDAYNCVISGVEALCREPWVDGGNIGLCGQSWGGYQTAYLITRTDIFKCAMAGAPVANMTSAYGGIRWGSGNSRQGQYEKGQSRIGKNIWEDRDLYIENSPLFFLDKVTTPLLIMHNDNDDAVPWYQGIELFMGLRRLHKPVWMLQYKGDKHNLRQRRNKKDISIREGQFFDYYLKGGPVPAWMKTGIPVLRHGQDFALEPIE